MGLEVTVKTNNNNKIQKVPNIWKSLNMENNLLTYNFIYFVHGQ